jgi:hypothetical protein
MASRLGFACLRSLACSPCQCAGLNAGSAASCTVCSVMGVHDHPSIHGFMHDATLGLPQQQMLCMLSVCVLWGWFRGLYSRMEAVVFCIGGGEVGPCTVGRWCCGRA